MTRKFLRSDTARHSRLGKNRKKLQKWRRPRGMHSKIRKKRFSYPLFPMTGFKTPKAQAGRIKGKIPLVVNNMNELRNAGKENIIFIAKKIGAKKRIEMLKIAHEMNIEIANGGKK